MDVWSRTFGPGVKSGPLARLAATLAAESGEAEMLTEHILRFTAVSTGPDDAPRVLTAAEIGDSTVIGTRDYAAFLQRFGGLGEPSAVRLAKSLFHPAPPDGRFALQPWYHGLTVPSADAATAALAGKPPGTFLVRLSATLASAMAVSYVVPGGDVRHTRLAHKGGQYEVEGGKGAPFPTLTALIAAHPGTWVKPLPSQLNEVSSSKAIRTGSTRHVDADTMYGTPGGAALGMAGASAAGGAGATATAAASTTAHVAAVPPPDTFDIMLSYQWDNQAIVRRIRDALISRYGLRVWQDEQDMGMAYVTEMVKAVKGARVVVCCTSAKYAASKNCTLEATQVYERGKPCIILNMEPGFYPGRCDGVVSVIAAGKLYCDFTTPDKFESGMASLARQLKELGIIAAVEPATARSETASPSVSAATSGDGAYVLVGDAAAAPGAAAASPGGGVGAVTAGVSGMTILGSPFKMPFHTVSMASPTMAAALAGEAGGAAVASPLSAAGSGHVSHPPLLAAIVEGAESAPAGR